MQHGALLPNHYCHERELHAVFWRLNSALAIETPDRSMTWIFSIFGMKKAW